MTNQTTVLPNGTLQNNLEETISTNKLSDLFQKITLGTTLNLIDDYKGGPDYDLFINRIQAIGRKNQWTEQDMMEAMEHKLKDMAKTYYFALRDDDKPGSIEEMRTWLKRVFGKRKNFQQAKLELAACKRKQEETLGAFAERIKMAANNIFSVEEQTPEKKIYKNALIAEQFINGLDTRLANEILSVGVFLNLKEALEVAEKKENIVDRLRVNPPQDLDVVATIRALLSEKEQLTGDDIEPKNLPNDRHRGEILKHSEGRRKDGNEDNHDDKNNRERSRERSNRNRSYDRNLRDHSRDRKNRDIKENNRDRSYERSNRNYEYEERNRSYDYDSDRNRGYERSDRDSKYDHRNRGYDYGSSDRDRGYERHSRDYSYERRDRSYGRRERRDYSRERELQRENRNEARKVNFEDNGPRGTNYRNAPRNRDERLPKFKYMFNRCIKCAKPGHYSSCCRSEKIFFCFNCGDRSHTYSNCFLNWNIASITQQK